MPWRPSFPGEYPTLGWAALDWVTENLGQPEAGDGSPLILTPEQARFVLQYYRLDPVTGQRVVRRACWSRPKGHGKSPLMGVFSALEALADVVPDGWDADGRPVGRPWSRTHVPKVQILAVAEHQTANTYDALLEMLRTGAVVDNYDIDPMETFVACPRGRIEPGTSAATTREGGTPIFVVLDQTESMIPSNGGVRLAAVARRNLGKRGGSSIESPNAYEPGAGSVAEDTMAYWEKIQTGRARATGLLVDHREAPADTDLTDRDSLLAGLAYAYGDSAIPAGGWVDLDRIVAEVWDPDTDPQDARRFYLNQVTHASDSWVSRPEWVARRLDDVEIDPTEPIVLGFDGSRGRARGHADATALVAVTVRGGHAWPIRIWQARDGEDDWIAPVDEVDEAVAATFRDFNVVGFYADPTGWAERVADWEAKYHKKLKVKATRDHPISVWPRGKGSNVHTEVERLRLAIVQGEMTHDGDRHLQEHVLNARRRSRRGGYLIYKEHPESARKIDGAYALVMAWKARVEALSEGLAESRSKGRARFF